MAVSDTTNTYSSRNPLIQCFACLLTRDAGTKAQEARKAPDLRKRVRKKCAKSCAKTHTVPSDSGASCAPSQPTPGRWCTRRTSQPIPPPRTAQGPGSGTPAVYQARGPHPHHPGQDRWGGLVGVRRCGASQQDRSAACRPGPPDVVEHGAEVVPVDSASGHGALGDPCSGPGGFSGPRQASGDDEQAHCFAARWSWRVR